MTAHPKIYVAGHGGLIGSAIVRTMRQHGETNIITPSHADLDLTNQAAVRAFFETEQPDEVYLGRCQGRWYPRQQHLPSRNHLPKPDD